MTQKGPRIRGPFVVYTCRRPGSFQEKVTRCLQKYEKSGESVTKAADFYGV